MGELEEVCELPRGYKLYRKPNGAGGYTYLTDDIGGGRGVLDTSLDDIPTLIIALAEEYKRRWEQETKPKLMKDRGMSV